MQNFGTPNPGAQGAQLPTFFGIVPQVPFPEPQGQTTVHYQQYKSQLQQYQNHQVNLLNQAANANQITPQQLQTAMHQVNEKIRQTFNNYQVQLQRNQQQQQQQQQQHHQHPQQQQQQHHQGQMRQQPQQGHPQAQYPAGPADGGQWRAPGAPGSMPPPQMAPGGQLQQMSAAEKKKMMEMKRMQAQQQQQQQQQAGGRGFPPGTTPQQQQQHQMRMQAMQQQQQHAMQNNGYPRMMGQPNPGQQTPQYPNPMSHQPASMQPLHHMPPPTPQQHGPASVPNPAQQQYQQQQYYQQQNQMQMQQQQQQMSQQQMQMHQQHHQQQQQHPSMQMPQQGMVHDGFHGQQMQHQQQAQMQAMQQQQQQQQQQMAQQQAQQQQAAQQAAAAQAQVPENPEQQRYNELLKEMKTQYLEVLFGMQRRQAQQKGLTQMIEILEGRRTVTWEHLQTLKGSLHRLMVRDCPTFPLMDEIRRAVERKMEKREKALAAGADKETVAATVEKAEKRLSGQKKTDPFGVSPWKCVKNLEIEVPESIRKLIENKKSPSPNRALLKRPHDGEATEYEMAEKRVKDEDGEPVEQNRSGTPKEFVVRTQFDRINWPMPLKAQEELREVNNWTIDDQFLPSSSTAPFIIVCAKASALLVNPLRIHLPLNYPHEPATVQFDRSFPQDSEYGPTLQRLFEKALGRADAIKTLGDFIMAFRKACAHFQKYRSHYQAGLSPDALQQPQQQQDEIVYASHYASRPAAPIAHKGMVM